MSRPWTCRSAIRRQRREMHGNSGRERRNRQAPVVVFFFQFSASDIVHLHPIDFINRINKRFDSTFFQPLHCLNIILCFCRALACLRSHSSISPPPIRNNRRLSRQPLRRIGFLFPCSFVRSHRFYFADARNSFQLRCHVPSFANGKSNTFQSESIPADRARARSLSSRPQPLVLSSSEASPELGINEQRKRESNETIPSLCVRACLYRTRSRA